MARDEEATELSTGVFVCFFIVIVVVVVVYTYHCECMYERSQHHALFHVYKYLTRGNKDELN